MCKFDSKDAEFLSKVVGAACVILVAFMKYTEKK